MNERFEKFVGRIFGLTKALQKIKGKEMKRFGLQARHLLPIYQLSVHPEGLTAGELVSLCEEDKAAISRALRDLLRHGIAETDSADGKYRTPYRLTEKGRALAAEMEDRIGLAVLGGSEGIAEAEQKSFYETLMKIERNLTRYLRGDRTRKREKA